MTMHESLARHIIHERVASSQRTRRPSHPTAARMLRRLAERVDPTS